MGFGISLSGISVASRELDVIGNNIANAGTAGFKKSSAVFTDLYAAAAFGSGGVAIGSGTNLASVNQLFSQGALTFTDNSLDLALNGQGFFELQDSNGSTAYTRNGAFQIDRSGFLVTPAGLNVRGYQADLTASPIVIGSTIGNVQIDRSNIAPNATTDVDITLNLDSNSTDLYATTADGAAAFSTSNSATYTNSTAVTVFDSLGNSHEMRYFFQKVGGGTGTRWNLFTTIDGTLVEATGVTATAGNDPVVFDFASSGTTLTYFEPAAAGNQPPSYDISGQVTPASAQTVQIDFGNTTQFGSPFSVQALAQDGYTTGRLDSVDVDPSGVIFGRYTNGQNRPLAQIILSDFSNPNGLQPLSDSTWGETFSSGSAVKGVAGTSTLGTIQGGALEDSNVDLTQELVRLIVAQRNFQANAQAVRTDDTVTQTILNFR